MLVIGLGPTPLQYGLIQLITSAKTLFPNKGEETQRGRGFGGALFNPVWWGLSFT